MGKFKWDMIDLALERVEQRGQTLLTRIALYGTGSERDLPDWYGKMVGLQKDWKYTNPVNKWVGDPEDPRYAQFFGVLIRAMGEWYDGHPILEAVDLLIVGAWGEGAGSERRSQKARNALIDAYTNSFKRLRLLHC